MSYCGAGPPGHWGTSQINVCLSPASLRFRGSLGTDQAVGSVSSQSQWQIVCPSASTSSQSAGSSYLPSLDARSAYDIDLGSRERAYAFMERLQNEQGFGYMAVSLGYFDTLMSCPAGTTSSEMPEEHRAVAGISPGLVRMSIGYTGTLEQRWRQLATVLEEVGQAPVGS